MKDRLKELITILEILFAKFFLNLNFTLKYRYTSWCRCLVSGFKGDLLKVNFLTIENKFSKHGYQSNNAIKKGDIFWLLL